MLGREVLSPIGVGVETERKSSVGVALVIVGIDPSRNGENVTSPKLWTILEKKTNLATEKKAGQISFPGETGKTTENLRQNIFGALVEEFSGDDQKIGNLWYVPEHSHVEGKVLISGRPADLVILIFTGDLNNQNLPLAKDEVRPYQWMTIGELLSEHPDRIRKFAREIAVMDQSEKFIGRAVSEFNHHPLNRVPLSALVPDNFLSMRQFHQERKGKKDIVIFSLPLKGN